MPILKRTFPALALLALLLSGCTHADKEKSLRADASLVHVKIIAFNDLHGHLEPPEQAVMVRDAAHRQHIVPAGGAAYLAGAITHLKEQNPHHAVVSAGDLIGASPLISSLFVDEPTIEAANLFGVDFNAVGNHEFDKGTAELLRMQQGGCEQHTARKPCALNGNFEGARFTFLAANTLREDGSTLFPPTGMKTFSTGQQQVRVGFIGLTLKETPSLVLPDGIRGLRFVDEAETANALVPQLKAQGADAIVVVLHQGGTAGLPNADGRCPDLAGGIVPILKRLSPEIDVVVSGHTHRSYICNYPKDEQGQSTRHFLLTSAGQYGTLLTDIDLTIDTKTRKVVEAKAKNIAVQSEAFVNARGRQIEISRDVPRFTREPNVNALITRYKEAAAPLAQKRIGNLTHTLTRAPTSSGESPLGNLIADAQLAATSKPENGNAQIAFMNPGGLRADLSVPPGGGKVNYDQLFAVQPFGNHLVVQNFTGKQLKMLLERQFSGANSERPRVLFPSTGFSYRYDLSKPAGHRISKMQLNGKPVVSHQTYRITLNSYLANGGDGFEDTIPTTSGQNVMLDIDALEAFFNQHDIVRPPQTNRILRMH